MAEKKVSVRLAAVGGDRVKAEFEGIGKAGQRGFRKVSREAEIANAKLAKFARRAKIAAGIMVAAALTAGIAMVRSGLQVIDEQAKLAASLRTTTESLQILTRAGDLAGVSMGEIQQATTQLTKRLSQAAAGTGPALEALQQLNLSAANLAKLPVDAKIAAIQDAIAKFIPSAQQAAVASQIFGDRAGLIFNLGNIFAPVLHAGGVVGGAAPQRMVPAMAFAGAPRMHSGGWAGLRPDEVPAILQKGERVLNRREAQGYGQNSGQNITSNIQTRDAESFRQSRTQVSADIARAVAMGRRGM